MTNKSLFSSITSVFPRATVFNEAGGPAYKFTAKHALAQVAATGTFSNVTSRSTSGLRQRRHTCRRRFSR